MDSADVRPGMTVADIGAGDGYYTVRLAPRVGATGRVLAQDIQPDTTDVQGLAVERLEVELGPSSPGSLVAQLHPQPLTDLV